MMSKTTHASSERQFATPLLRDKKLKEIIVKILIKNGVFTVIDF